MSDDKYRKDYKNYRKDPKKKSFLGDLFKGDKPKDPETPRHNVPNRKADPQPKSFVKKFPLKSPRKKTHKKSIKQSSHGFNPYKPVKNLFYWHSGKIGSKAIIIGLPLMLFLIGILSRLYIALSFNGFMSLIMLIGITTIIYLFKIRNANWSKFFSITAGIAALYFSWVSFLADQSSSISFTSILSNPVEFLRLLAEDLSSRISISNFIFWSIEAITLLTIPYFTNDMIIQSNVFCEDCDEFAKEEIGIFSFIHPNVKELKAKFLKQDLSFIDQAKIAPEDSKHYFKIDAEWCEHCENLHTLSLREVQRSFDDEGDPIDEVETIFEDLLVTKDIFDKIMNLDFKENQKEP